MYFSFSSGDFSFLLTLSSILESLSFVGIILQARTSPEGLSVNTFIIYSVLYFSRLCSIIFYPSYLPYDSTGDWLYQVIEVFSFLQSLWISNKLIEKKESPLILFLFPVFILFSFLINPALNKNRITDAL